MTIWDAGGEGDTYNFSNYATDLFVDLRPGGWTTVSQAQLADLDGDPGTEMAAGNIANSLAVETNGVIVNLIENVIGGVGHDRIFGNDADNTITGGGGNDTYIFEPGFGLDQIIDFDDSGDDTIVFSTAVFADWAEVQLVMTESDTGTDVVITLDANNTVTLLGTALADMTESDFAFLVP
jgi:serralysin